MKEIPGTNGAYYIAVTDNEAKCWSARRNKYLSNNTYRGRVRWSINYNGKQIKQDAGRWVALTFPEICGEYFDGAEIDHKDTNTLNNNPNNLHWVTRTGNANNPLTRLHKSQSKLNRTDMAIPVRQYTKDGAFLAEFPSLREASRVTDVCVAHISKCCLNKRKSAGGFVWKLAQNI